MTKSKDIEAAARKQQQHLQLISHNNSEQQQQQLNSNNNNNNNSANSSEIKKEKLSTMSYCFHKRWLLILSMTVVLILTAILVAILTTTLLDDEDKCHSQAPFQQASYKLYATKTAYSVAYNQLNNNQTSSSVVKLPQIFSESDSLSTLNQRLLSKEFNCKVRQLHYFGRHAARFPSQSGIQEINKLIKDVQTRIDLSKFSPPNVNQNLNNQVTGNTSSTTSPPCYNPLAEYKTWETKMAPEQANLVLESGIVETAAIANRFKSIYPEMFDGQQSRIDIGTTNELRTAQTALVFVKVLENFNLDFCSLDQFPSDNIQDKTKAEEITENECYRKFMRKYSQEKLQFHKKCESLHKEDFPILHHLNLNQTDRTQFIANSVSKKLKLAKDDYLNTEETDAIYKICKYETAMLGSSRWCNLLSDSDLKFYEYMEDVDDFFKVFGHPDQMRSACPATTELMRSFKAAARNPSASRESHFYFSHSQVIQRILAASVDLEQDPEYSPKTIQDHLRAGTVPNRPRQWRSSIFTPFSANLAFTLYECPKRSTSEDSIDFNANESPLKVVASLNERPILLDGCSSHVCDLNELTTDSRIDREKRCKLEDICRKNIVVT